MKKFLTVAAIGALVAVAGCSDKSENAGGTVKREAGNWKTDVKLVKFEVPGMPPEMKDGMTKMMEGASGLDQCFTQEQVDKEDITSELAKGRTAAANAPGRKRRSRAARSTLRAPARRTVRRSTWR